MKDLLLEVMLDSWLVDVSVDLLEILLVLRLDEKLNKAKAKRKKQCLSELLVICKFVVCC